MFSIPQSTPYVVMFKAYLASDHATEATGKTIAITISKNGGAFGNPNVGALNATEVSSGWYKFTLDTTDTNTVGPVAYRGAVATIDDVGERLNVVSATSGGATNLDAAITSRPDAAAVKTQVVNALSVDTYTEPGQGAPGATISLAAKINYLFKAWRNRTTQSSSTYALYADDATTVDQIATVSDDGTTFTRGEVATGP